MARVLVSGLVNLEVTARVDGFPVAYAPVRYETFGVGASVSGVGYNVAKALTTLGDNVQFLSIVGRDDAAALARAALRRDGIAGDGVLSLTDATAHSVILHTPDGRRAILLDLKAIQETTYPPERVASALERASVAVLANVNFSRPMLRLARQAGVLVATDVHAIADLDDAYNREFMIAADILFLSHENLPLPPEDWARAAQGRYGPRVVVVGLGADGALLAVRDDSFVGRFPAVPTRPIANTIGAGDALFSAFVHVYAASGDPYLALRKALVFASWKIGANGGAEGFLDGAGLDGLYTEIA